MASRGAPFFTHNSGEINSGEMRKRKTFAFSPSNFLVGASEFSAEETGAYIRLLCIQFEKVGIPSGDAKLCELTGTGIEVIRKVKKKFGIAMEVDGEKRLFNERLLKDMRIPHTPLKKKATKEEVTSEPQDEPTKIAMPRDSETEIRKEYEALTKGIREVSEFIRKHRPRFIVPYIDLWNMFADKHKLPRVQQANENRKRKVACRAKEEMFDFPSILGKAKEQSFLLSGTWFTFDWLITNDTNYLKVLEGNYKGKETVTTKTEQTVYEGSFLGAKKEQP